MFDYLSSLMGFGGSSPAAPMRKGIRGGAPMAGSFGGMADPTEASVASIAGIGGGDRGFWGSMLDRQNKDGSVDSGWGGMALGGLQGILGAYNSMKQFGLAEDMFDESKRQYNQDYAAQRTLLNGQMEDRQRARYAANPGAYATPDEYMKDKRIR
jgi:hypothetical protein